MVNEFHRAWYLYRFQVDASFKGVMIDEGDWVTIRCLLWNHNVARIAVRDAVPILVSLEGRKCDFFVIVYADNEVIALGS